MAWLLGIRDEASIQTHAARGALFETWVVSELIKQRYNAGQPADLYFWRDSAGHEVDVIYETPRGLQAIEVKSGSTFASDWPEEIHKWQTLTADAAVAPVIIYGGTDSYDRQGCHVTGWRDLTSVHNPANAISQIPQ